MIFGTPPGRPLIVEIGFGYGQMLRYLAQQRPDANIVGFEIASQCLIKAEGAIRRGLLPNVRVVYARAETALYHLLTPESMDEVHINFPDPWFKTRHEHRRLMQRATLDVLVSRLKPGGKFYLATDIQAYAAMSAELLAATPGLTNLLDAPWRESVPGASGLPRTITKYEARARREGRVCHYFALVRNSHPAPAVPVMEDLPVPHMVFDSPLTLTEIQAQFTPASYSERGVNINYLNAYVSDRAVLIEAYIDEPTIEQRVALMLVRRELSDEYTLQPGLIGSPRPTAGMHIAVQHLGAWLVSLHPATRVLQDKTRQPQHRTGEATDDMTDDTADAADTPD